MKKILILIICFFLYLYNLNQFKNQKDIEKNSNIQLKQNIISVTENLIKEKEYPKEEIEKYYNGYEVCAKLDIPKISLQTSVLANFSEDALKNSVVKFWGSNPNCIGNFCIAGHNFINKNMFSKLRKLEIGDRIFLTDFNIGKVEYEIFKIDIVLPENIECLNAVTTNEREITLITCTTNSKKRIVIKAKEI